MLINAMNQMLCSNNNIIKKLDRELIQISNETDEKFWSTINFQEKIIKLYEEQIKKIKNKEEKNNE